MIRTFLVLFLSGFIFYHPLQAQDESKLDSLKKAVKKAQTDTAKLNALFHLSIESANSGKIKEAREYRDEAGKLASTIALPYFNGLAALCDARVKNAEGNFEAAVISYEKAVDFFGSMDAKKKPAGILLDIGNRLNDLGKNQLALTTYKQALATFRLNADVAHEASVLRNLGQMHIDMGNFDSAQVFFFSALEKYTKVKDTQGINETHQDLGILYLDIGKLDSAVYYSNLTIEEAKKTGNEKLIGLAYVNLANVSTVKSNYPEALDYYFKAENIFEKIKYKKGLSLVIGNTGIAYYYLKDYENSLKYFRKGLEFDITENSKSGIATSYHNIGLVLAEKGEPEKALEAYNEAKRIREELGEDFSLISTLNNIGTVYTTLKKDQEAMPYFEEALALAEKKDDVFYKIVAMCSLGQTKVKLGQVAEGKKLCLESLTDSRSMQIIELVKENCLCLYEAESKLKNHEAALEYYTEFTALKDSMFNDSKSREFGQLETKFEYEKKIEQEKLEQEKRDVLAREELKRKNQQRNALFGGVALVSLFAIFIFNRYKVIGKQKKVIEVQKKEVDDKNKRITESIQYALRIQTAILPPEKLIREYLKDSFVLYLPKDIVAGDFYWMEVLKGPVLFAACDCTGHGVPGAMVSVMCHNALNRAVHEFGLSKPALILDKVTELLADNFVKSEENISDGMDTSLCAFYPEENRLEWAGANNPLWIIRNGEIVEYQPNKQPVGKFDYRQPYTNHEIQLQPGDTLYVFTDGYSDQFDPEERKLMKKGFRNILLSIQEKSMEEQCQELKRLHLQWKGTMIQLDDICVIGVRV